MGSRFSLSSNHTITAIGGHLSVTSGSVWGAIVALPGPTAIPDFDPLDIESHALTFAVFELGPSADYRETVNVVLGPGDYTLVFGGSDLFGTINGGGFMPSNGTEIGSPSYFFRSGAAEWTDGSVFDARFVVEGEEGGILIPEPSSYVVATGLAVCFGLAGWWRRRRRT